jgi:hypothetical protein
MLLVAIQQTSTLVICGRVSAQRFGVAAVCPQRRAHRAPMAAAAFKKQLSETFAQLSMPPALDQIEPELLAKLILHPEPNATLHVVDVRQPEEFNAGHVKGAKNLPMDSFDPEALVASVLEDVSSGKKPLVVFVSSQSPDIDANCALTFVRAWEEKGLDAKTGVHGASVTATLLGGFVFWLQQNRKDDALTSNYVADVWDSVLASAPSAASA